MLAIENLHWAQASTRDLAEHLLDLTNRAQLQLGASSVVDHAGTAFARLLGARRL